MKWIRWTLWTGSDHICGQFPLKDVDREIQKFEARAALVLKETGADHVLYAVKYYEADELDRVSFYMMPMSDEEYEEKVVKLEGVRVYALHARR